MSEPKEPRSKSRFRTAYIVTTVAISCLMIGASMGIIISGTTPTIPTIIQPGSMVSTADYVIFQDGANFYAKNGTSGYIAYSGTNALTLFNFVIGQLPHGGMVFAQDGIYTFATPLIITTPYIIINGISQNFPNSAIPAYTQPYGTRFVGNITVEAPNVHLNYLSVIGTLNFTSTADFSSIADWCGASHLYIYGTIDIVGLPGASDAQVPYNLAFDEIFILHESPGTNAINLKGLSSGIVQHIYFTNSDIYQGAAGSSIWVSTNVNDVSFTNCLLATSSATAVLNLTGAGTKADFQFNHCMIELNGGTGQVFFSKSSSTSICKVSIFDSVMVRASLLRYLVRDDSLYAAGSGAPSDITFNHFTYDSSTLRVRSGDPFPKVLMKFLNCNFPTSTSITQVNGEYIGLFENCANINPIGLLATPFSGVSDDWKCISIASSYTGSAAPPASKNITVMDTAILVTASGGSGLSISIYDRAGNAVVSAAANLLGYYIPIGFKINFGAFSGGPTITVIGV